MSNGTIISKIILTINTVISQINLLFEFGWINSILVSIFSIKLPIILIAALNV